MNTIKNKCKAVVTKSVLRSNEVLRELKFQKKCKHF